MRFISDWPEGVYPGDGEPQPLDNKQAVSELLARMVDERVFGERSPMDRFEEAVQETMLDLAATLVSKQNDYGPAAINRAPGGALNGINVRLHDKLSRAINLTPPSPEDVRYVVANHESVRDTYADLANYAVIALLVLDGAWPQ